MSTAAIQKHLHLYTHFSSVIFVCIISKLKTGLVLAFCLYLTQVCLLIVEVCLVFSCMCWNTCATKGWQPPVSQPSHSTPAALTAEHQPQHHLPAWHGQGRAAPKCGARAVQCSRAQCGAMGSLHPSFSFHGWLMHQQGQSARTKMFKSSCHMATDV